MMDMTKRKYLAQTAGLIGLMLIGVASFFYSVMTSDFAEIAIRPGFLDFPIFIGEILLFICLLLLSVKIVLGTIRFERWHGWLMVYLLWVVTKALWGYFHGGPLAFRHAALFYYPVFTVLGYYFYRHNFVSRRMKVILVTVLGYCLLTDNVTTYFLWAYVIFYVILTLSLKNNMMRNILLGGGVLLFLFKFPMLFSSSRSHMIGMTSVFVFFIVSGAVIVYRKNPRLGILLPGVLGLVFLIGIFRYSDKNALTTLLTPAQAREKFAEYDAYLTEHEKDYVFRVLPYRLYHDNQDFSAAAPLKEEWGAEGTEGAQGNRRYRPLDTAYGNIAFRIFIWRDMWRELLAERPWFGFSFSRPQRSKSLEILDMARVVWSHDGWITPHNSYLHILYRAGLLGLAMIVFVGGFFIKLVRDFAGMRSLPGILLCSLILYWMAIANFLVFLELPYNAIPFWTVFGLAAAYRRELKSRMAT